VPWCHEIDTTAWKPDASFGTAASAMSETRILIAGVGNVLFGDDAFGVEVARRLAHRPLPEDVRVIEFGIRGFDLACALLDAYETAIIVDAAPRGGVPGTLHVLEPNFDQAGGSSTPAPIVELHSLDPARVLRLARALGSRVERVLVVGCEPQPPVSVDEFRTEMSEPVRAAVDEAVRLIESLVTRILATASGDGDCPPGVSAQLRGNRR
jgi:hydrogenase maturation protease